MKLKKYISENCSQYTFMGSPYDYMLPESSLLLFIEGFRIKNNKDKCYWQKDNLIGYEEWRNMKIYHIF